MKKYRMILNKNNCFICGTTLNQKNKSEEHIYPLWLQKKFNLQNLHLVLLNKTDIKYKNLKIPCCKKCNNFYNKKTEDPIKKALELGYDEFVKLNEKTIITWVNKIAYGTLYKEAFLKLDRKSEGQTSIIKKDFFDEHNFQFLLLQSVVCNTEFIGDNPWCIYIFKIKTSGESIFDVKDYINDNCFFMQMNNVGIMVTIGDKAIVKKILDKNIAEFNKKEIYSIQFWELCAYFYATAIATKHKAFYKWSRKHPSNKITHFITNYDHVKFEPISMNEYIKIFNYMLIGFNYDQFPDYSEDEIYKGQIYFLKNEDGSIRKDFS